MDDMLEYYGFITLADFAASVGLSITDAARLLEDMYTDDTAPLRD